MMKKISDFLPSPSGNEKKSGHKGHAGLNFISLLNNWEKIVGPKLSQHSIPLQHRQNTLTILTEHAVYSQALSFSQNILIKKIGEVLPPLRGKIEKMRFQSNTQFFNQKMESLIKREPKKSIKLPHKYSPEFRVLKENAKKLFNEVGDDEDIKELLVSLAMQLSEDQGDQTPPSDDGE